jgi:hypothetical protein
VLFIRSGKYVFSEIHKSKFESDWVFGIDKRPQNKMARREYFTKFESRTGCGTVIRVTEWRKKIGSAVGIEDKKG